MPKLRQPRQQLAGQDEALEDQDQDIQQSQPAVDAQADQGGQEDAAEALQAQLAELRKSEETQRNRADQAVREREEAIRRAQEREAQVTQFQREAVDSQFDAVSSAIAAASAEAEKAQQDIENAASIGDSKAQAEAYRRLARAESNLTRLEDGKTELEAKRKAEPTVTQSQPQQSQDPLANSTLPEMAKSWLRSHPDYLSDARKNSKIQALHWDVVDEGHAPFSQAYFESLEEHLGLRQQAQSNDYQPVQQQQRTSIVSAPVSREVPNGGGQRTASQVKLSVAQREAAKLAGITEKVYAEQLQKLNSMKADGTYGDRQ